MFGELLALSLDNLMDLVQMLVGHDEIRETGMLNIVAAEGRSHSAVGQLTLLGIRFFRGKSPIGRRVDCWIGGHGGMGHVKGRRRGMGRVNELLQLAESTGYEHARRLYSDHRHCLQNL